MVKLIISKDATVGDVQKAFAACYGFLKLEFYKFRNTGESVKVRERMPQMALLKSAGLKESGYIEISDDMTVGDLEKKFLEQFGLLVQVSRNSGGIWLETTMTDKWSLLKQDNYGREIRQTTRGNISHLGEL